MPSLKSPLGLLTVLVFHLLQTHSSNGQSQLIGPSQPILATVGDDIILPCHLEPAEDVTVKILEWTRSDLKPSYVHVARSGQDLRELKHPSYKDRTSLIIEELKHGNISLKLSKVKLSDKGTYKCYIHENRQSFVKLVVVSDAVSSAVIRLAGTDRDRGGVVLQCESKGWHPQPEVFWLDGEGNLLSAGPTETVRGPDGLYTVSSRVTVEKSHNNNFTCRVRQNNQTRETHIYIPDDFFLIPDQPGSKCSSSSSVPTIIGVIIGNILILAVVFVVWKLRQNKLKNKKKNQDEETQRMRKTSNSTSNDPEQESLIKTEKEREMMKNEDKKMNSLSEETQLQCETGKETHQRETNNVLVQTQEGTVQQSVNEVANLSVPVKEETDKLLKEGRTKTGLDKREKETGPTTKRAEATASAETCQQQSEQQSVNNDGEGQPKGIIAGEVKKNDEDEEKKTQSTTEAEKEKETEVDNERERLLKQLKTKEREEKTYQEKILKYDRNITEHKFKINQLRAQLEEVEKKLQFVNSETDEMDAETQKVEKHIKNDLERKKAELQEDLQKTEKALQRNKCDLNHATEKKMKIINEKKEIIEKLEEIENQRTNQSDSDEDL
ncbi:selection and upkeep of intraepithelial T-cells protein 6-like [Scomber scombrus]|uniref:selection and upkeep of intraepithelial T-cells protein 6-like n=1 Tax=Scomber scombrus TaxID=13677 RepID=UPI002DDA8764|nr:selection and upkeep of intraepithelial T-cells protein 6-like [Scomber scombrus]XP_062301172.1 selection and upkeep of intraepithelial T-cells protein 6-like [Scomber scombrus]